MRRSRSMLDICQQTSPLLLLLFLHHIAVLKYEYCYFLDAAGLQDWMLLRNGNPLETELTHRFMNQDCGQGSCPYICIKKS